MSQILLPQTNLLDGKLLKQLFLGFYWLICSAGAFQLNLQAQEPGKSPAMSCSANLEKKTVEDSFKLAGDFLLQAQKPSGNFMYAYDWQRKRELTGDNQVRQAGTLWGLALAYAYSQKPQFGRAVLRGIKFFRSRSRELSDSGRYVIYPGERAGATGTIALIALAYIDYLRAAPEIVLRKRKDLLTELDQYLQFLMSLRRSDGLWYSRYRLTDGKGYGTPSPYADGEAILAITKAARYLGRKNLIKPAFDSADSAYQRYVTEARRKHPDSPYTKGFYQWGSMSFYELATSSWPQSRKFGPYVIELADWMIDVHRTLERRKNTAYAYEGIIHAYQLAKKLGLKDKQVKFGCVIARGLNKLISWQVGGPLANNFAKKGASDSVALGGVQNAADEALLRIDVTQHQAHALILALRYFDFKSSKNSSGQP
ncbi:MAG: hypothetical protein D6719_07020 [Candidatus Dadabacteria bacterium]|nr:MAG: hypothetical protein D6719_07020 [Candidatus Dadabacteria bacterium]